MEAFGVERMPMPAPPLEIRRTARDDKSHARQRAFEQALKKRRPELAPATAAASGAPAHEPASAGAAHVVQTDGDGMSHVDVLV